MLRAVSENKKDVLINFCSPYLQPTVTCDTISTEGYDVTNLIKDPCNGFLAYSCIKPPVQIDFTFPCEIQIHHILIWPSVGSQKSSGFQIYAKICNNNTVPYTLLSSGCLNADNAGVLFYAANVNPANISVPSNFLKRYIKGSAQNIISQTKKLRICIFKTQNSVPALGRIEIWGSPSPRCSKDVRTNINALWSASQTPVYPAIVKNKSDISCANSKDADSSSINKTETALDIPDCFLDALTWEIMTQPIALPSGKIIDQTTLQKHGESEALWGRSLSDPFTGLPFNENRKPVIATALKIRIDKFLLENSNVTEIKKLPRVLGSKSDYNRKFQDKKSAIFNLMMKDSTKMDANAIQMKVHAKLDNISQKKSRCHQLPLTPIHSRRIIPYTKKIKTSNLHCDNTTRKSDDKEVQENNLNDNIDDDIQAALSHLKRFSTPESLQPSTLLNNCDCCTNSIFYKLPCKHIVCRKVLTTMKKNQCHSCGSIYEKSAVERVYD